MHDDTQRCCSEIGARYAWSDAASNLSYQQRQLLDSHTQVQDSGGLSRGTSCDDLAMLVWITWTDVMSGSILELMTM